MSLVLLSFLILSCTGATKERTQQQEDTITQDILESIDIENDIDSIVDLNIKKSESFFYTQRIDSNEYVKLKDKYDLGQPTYITMTDFDSVSVLLEGVVTFDKERQGVERFNFRNGTVLQSPYQEEDAFVAYYPEFDILRLESGHSMDVAYNLTTGDSIENTGLPPYMKFSPNKKYLFNGYYNGQSFDFFIQQKEANSYKTLGYIDWDYDFIQNYFWINDSTLCLDIPDLYRYLLFTIKSN